MGNHVHASLKDFLSLVPAPQRTFEALERILSHRWAKDRSGFEDADQEQEYLERARQQLRWFVASQDVTVAPFMTERYHEAPLAQGVILRGRIDRVDKEADGTLHIIDYKTGKLPAEVDDEPLLLYALILSRALHSNVSRTTYLFLAEGATHTFEPASDLLEEAKGRALATARQIEAEEEFPPQPGSRCLDCDFAVICEER